MSAAPLVRNLDSPQLAGGELLFAAEGTPSKLASAESLLDFPRSLGKPQYGQEILSRQLSRSKVLMSFEPYKREVIRRACC